MKRILFALTAAMLLLGLCSCEDDQDAILGSGTASREDISYQTYSGPVNSGGMTFEGVFSIEGEWHKVES